MQFGVLPPYHEGVAADPEWMVEFARHAEAVGFESLYVPEHAVVPSGYQSRYPYAPDARIPVPIDCPFPDPLELLAFLAAATETLVLATGILILPQHHPVILAKRVATLDALSGGRARLGIGVGWMREEFDAVDADFDNRGARADEMIVAMRALWSEAEADFSGRFYSFEGAISRPQPVRPGGVPIHIGGHSTAAARRAGRLGQGFQPLELEGEALADKLAIMRTAAVAAGRDPDLLEVTLLGVVGFTTSDDVARAEESGATRLVMGAAVGDLRAVKDDLSRAADALIHP